MEKQEAEDDLRRSRSERHRLHITPAHPPGPLIDRVTNGWRGDVKTAANPPTGDDYEPGICDFEDEGSCPNVSRDLVRSRRFRRMMALVLLLLLVAYYAWQAYLRPRLQQEWNFKEGFLPGRVNGTYGIARAGDFDGTTIRDIHPDLLPGGVADHQGKRRLVFIGDIHGCRKELLHLLHSIDFDPTTDHLIATGDVISKGPNSPGVLDELIKVGAESVRGNHEDRLVEAAKTLLSTDLQAPSAATTSKGYAKDAALLKELKPRHMRYLHDMPLMLRIPALPLAKKRKGKHHIAEDIIVVHAGLVPHVPLDRQDPYFVMNMRSIDHKTHVPSALHETKTGNSKPWFDVWNWYQDRLDRGRSVGGFHVYSYAEWLEKQIQEDGWFGKLRGSVLSKALRKLNPQVAVYGHDSKMGLQVHRWSKGLDSGCVSGGRLTAMVLDARGETEVVQVGCKNYR
ncbi:hypothetical protein B0A55_06786 [Friedmanniomyces simplex]|uniref:Calcineurin-like phosphoesterase domain-containing protein n=1 Tax=Friedmanniomyces simplex TaxID=329884 RepID=A0A4U0X9P6_9PEZI|nr:hypothetical protein B0A55_06786 [Friedmanniomyces simplex]